MTADFWVHAETFYNTIMVAVFIIILLAVMLSGMIFAYSKSPHKKKITAGGGMLAVLLGIGLIVGHLKYQAFLPVNDHVTPLVRDRQKTFGGYTYRSPDEMDYFARLYDPESVRALNMYQEDTVMETVTYVGKDEFFYYFEHNGKLFKQRTNVVFDKEAKASLMLGSAFSLEDEAFLKIGFRNPPYYV